MDIAITEIIYRLDINDIISLKSTCINYKSLLDKKEILFILSKRFELFMPPNFNDLIYHYDHKYLTKRCFKYYYPYSCLIRAATDGNLEIVEKAIKEGAKNICESLSIACMRGHYEIVQTLVKHYKNSCENKNFYLSILENAANNGHILITKFLAKEFKVKSKYYIETAYNKAIELSAFHGNNNKLSILFDEARILGINVLNVYRNSIFLASLGGHSNVIQMLIQLAKKSYIPIDISIYNQIMINGAFGGHKNIVQNMINIGANNYNTAMCLASKSGHMEIVKIMLDSGAHDYNSSLLASSFGGHFDILTLMISLGARNYKEALDHACEGGTQNSDLIVETLLKKIYLANIRIEYEDYIKFLYNSVNSGNIGVTKLILGARHFRDRYADSGDYFPILRRAVIKGNKLLTELILEKALSEGIGCRFSIQYFKKCPEECVRLLCSAVAGGNMEILKMFIDITSNISENEYKFMLASAIAEGNKEIAEILITLSARADINIGISCAKEAIKWFDDNNIYIQQAKWYSY
jgi:ankyrin repeat protein